MPTLVEVSTLVAIHQKAIKRAIQLEHDREQQALRLTSTLAPPMGPTVFDAEFGIGRTGA